MWHSLHKQAATLETAQIYEKH